MRSRFPRQTHVQNHDIVVFGDGSRLSVVAVGDEVNSPALLLETALDELSYGGIVFNDEDSHLAE